MPSVSSQSSTIVQPATVATIEAVGQNIALIFQAAQATGQSEATVREALRVFDALAAAANLSASSSHDDL